VKNSLKTKIR